MRRTAASLLLVLAFSAPVEARLGESEVKCQERYGNPSEGQLEMADALVAGASSWSALAYLTRGLRIQVVFKDREAVFIQYANAPVFTLDPGRGPSVDLTQREIAALRKANAPEDQTWRTHRDALVDRLAPQLTIWKTGDGKRYAGYDREQRELFVCDSAFWELVIEEVRKRHGKESKGTNRLEGL